MSTTTEQAQPLSGGHRSRLRARFLKSGFDGFAEHEIIELLLTLCIPRRDVKPQAKALLARFGTLRAIWDAPLEELARIPGVGEVASISFKIIKEAASLYLQESSEEQTLLNSTYKLEQFWRFRLGGLENEVFEVAYLDNAYRLLKGGVERLEEGVVNKTQVYPRKVMEAALRRSASGLVVAHNHPTGRVQPSEHDMLLTQALVQAASSLDLKIVDHIIVGANECFSFKRAGLV